jgi:hypothetical protein
MEGIGVRVDWTGGLWQAPTKYKYGITEVGGRRHPTMTLDQSDVRRERWKGGSQRQDGRSYLYLYCNVVKVRLR